MGQQLLVFGVLIAALALFMSGRVRYDLVALGAALLLVLARVLAPGDIFAGFGNDAVVSVIAIMIVGRAIRRSGATEPFAAQMLRMRGGRVGHTLALTGTSAFFSAFMNNTGALTIFLPIAIHMAKATHRLASALLIPLAYATLLGGMVSLIGTPPNILISSFRAEHLGKPYAIFDFARVGLPVALVGVAYLGILGWRLLPARRGSATLDRTLRMPQFFAEAHVPAGSFLANRTLADLADLSVDANVVGIVRGERRIAAPLASEPIQAGDLLLVEAEATQLDRLVARAGLELGGDRVIAEEEIGSPDVVLQNVVVARASPLVGRTPKGLRLRWRYGMNVLAISRKGARITRRLSQIRFRPGDVLFIQVRRDGLDDLLQQLHLPTLVDTAHRKPSIRRLAVTLSIFGCALLAVSVGVAPLGISFLIAALALIVARQIELGDAISAVDWSIVVLLGATIPLGKALEISGGAETVANSLLSLTSGAHVMVSLIALMVVTILLSATMNNAATVVLMAPIGYRMALASGEAPDPYLMAVAVAASADFLTPVGHQCNLLVMGPGGYRFGDYARAGIPLLFIVVLVGVPALLLFWRP